MQNNPNLVVLFIFHITARMLQSGFLVTLSALRIMYMNFPNILSKLLVWTFLEQNAEILHQRLAPHVTSLHICHVGFLTFLMLEWFIMLLECLQLERSCKAFHCL
jgi:hypothetical protein